MTQGRPVVLITGASSGVGADISLRLLQEGYPVYGAARRVERMKGAPPLASTNLIVTALRAHTPRTRYHAGPMAALLLFMRARLPTRMLDRLVMSGLG